MTAEPDLLPCPWCGEKLASVSVSEGSTFHWRKVDGCCADGPEVRHNTMAEDQEAAEVESRAAAIAAWNTRANVAHATAARDAEIEALRAEVEMLRDAFSDEDMTAGAHWFGRYVEQKRSAERLAEALRPHIEDLERSAVVLDQYPAMAPTAAEMRKAAAELRAALNPTAAQENDDA